MKRRLFGKFLFAAPALAVVPVAAEAQAPVQFLAPAGVCSPSYFFTSDNYCGMYRTEDSISIFHKS